MNPRPNKRILIVTDLWSRQPYGIYTVITNLKKELEKQGCTVDILEPDQFFTVPFPLYEGVRLAIFAHGSVRRTIKRGNYDFVHIVTEGPLGWYARSACRRLRVPFTSAVHGQLHLYAEVWLGKFVGRLIRNLMVRFHEAAAVTLVTTKVMHDQMRDFGLQRVVICPLGISDIFFTRGTCPVELAKPVFMFLGRISSEKSVEEFLALDLPGTKLVVGDGPDRKKTEARFPGVRFVGYQKGDALVSWCSCADVLVMPSRTETFGLVMVEALAREIVTNGVNGYLDEDLVHAAKQCLTISPDSCRTSVEQFRWSTSAATFLSIHDSITGDVERVKCKRTLLHF